ncbi:MAG: sulfatase family protein [Blastocatellia bacterium]
MTPKSQFLVVSFSFLVMLAWLLPSNSAVTAQQRPNIVVILADDLGYGDLGCYNSQSKIPTPRLDQLAKQGLRFTDAHSPSAVCTPTRYALLTGRYPWRSRLKSGVLGPYGLPLIESDRMTLPTLLKQQGYATAIVGKWHLGWDWPTTNGKAAAITAEGMDNVDYSKPVANGPLTRGFDFYFGTDVPNYPPYVFIENDRTLGVPGEPAPMIKGAINRKGPMVKGWEPVKILPALTERAVRYVDERAKNKQPFFLYFALTSPHYPVVPSPEFTGKSRAGVYGDFVAQTDAAVGAVLDALKRNGFDKNTLVIFTSDNGPEVVELEIGAYERIRQSQHASMLGLRGVKRDNWEGGHRVPFIARWPGRISAGKTSDALIGHIDLMATLASLIKAKLPDSAAPDSYDQSSVLLGQKRKQPIRQTLVHHQINGHLALRHGDWVLIDSKTCGDGNKEPEWFRRERGAHDCTGEAALYNLRDDPGQTKNLYDTQSAKARELKTLLDQYRQNERTAPPTVR